MAIKKHITRKVVCFWRESKSLTTIAMAVLILVGVIVQNITVPELVSAGSGMPSDIQEITGGSLYTCARADGRAYCWGDNTYGQLGDGTTTQRKTPVAVSTLGVLSGKIVTSIAAGDTHVCAIADGWVYCWGEGTNGRLGNGTTSNKSSPVAVSQGDIPGSSTILHVAAGGGQTCAIASNNKTYCWGYGSSGRLGNGSTSDHSTPVAVSQGSLPSGSEVSYITAGNSHTCVIASANSKAYCWGGGGSGRLGNGSTSNQTIPVTVSQGVMPSGSTILQIIAANSHTCAVASNNQAYCWGNGSSGRLGNGSTSDHSTPVAVSQGVRPSGSTVLGIKAGSASCLIASDNRVYCWGKGDDGRLGNGSTSSQNTPVMVDTAGDLKDKDVDSITVGDSHTCAVAEGWAYCWGDNASGEIGDGLTADRNKPVAVVRSTIDIISESYRFFENANNVTPGEPLADANTAGKLSRPRQDFRLRMGLSGIKGLDMVSSGSYFTCALARGDAYCWGLNSKGQLGDNSTTNRNTPVAVKAPLSGKTVTRISAGGTHACAVADGQAYCWGEGTNGRLGNGSTSDKKVPTIVSRGEMPSGVTVLDIVASESHTCALASDSNVYCWGYGSSGRLGNNSTSDKTTPVVVSQGELPTGVTIKEISTSSGGGHTCALATDSKAYCWGKGDNGRLGNNSTSDQTTPVATWQGEMPSGSIVSSVIAANSHSCAIASDEQAYCWGYGSSGRLGNGSLSNQTTPVAISQGEMPSGLTILQVSGGSHACVLASNYKIYCWGKGDDGRLGNGSTDQQNTAVAVDMSGVLSDKIVLDIAVGDSHTCAVSSGVAYCWGANTNGGLGDGTTTSKSVPVAVNDSLFPGPSEISANINRFSLEFAELTASSCSVQTTGYLKVTDSTQIAFRSNPAVANGATISQTINDPVPGIMTVAQSYISGSDGFTNSFSIPVGFVGLFDFSLRDNKASPETNYCIRIAYEDGTPLEEQKQFPQIETADGELSIGIVDESDGSVASPSFELETAVTQTKCQTVTGTLGVNNQRIKIFNSLTSDGWSVVMSATDGQSARWQRQGGGQDYDYNDPSGSPPGCNSGSDGDGIAGQLTIKPSDAIITPESGCNVHGISKGSNSSFSQGVVDSIGLLVASSETPSNCLWHLTDVGLSQQIPVGQPNGTYRLDITITVIAL